MTKADLIAAIAEKTEFTKKDAGVALDAILEVITGVLQSGDKVQLVGFGAFEVRNRAARQGKNPKTGEKVSIPATKVPAFKAGKALKEAIAE